jgi:hypothetical protein
LREPVSETKKVTDFLAGILCPKLDMAKAHILGMDILNENFSAYQNYIKPYHLNVKESEKIQMNVAQVQQTSNASSNQGSYQPKKKPRKGQISNKDWNNLTGTQKEAIRVKRAADKLQKKRTVSKAVMINEDQVTPPNAGTEFGKNAHKKAKK